MARRAGRPSVRGRGAPRAIALMVAMSIAGCGTEPVQPAESDATPSLQPTASRGAETVSPSIEEPSDSLPTLPELGDLQLSCGSPLTFDAAALQQARGAETLYHPATAPLRDLKRQGAVPDRAGWRLVVLTASSAQFLLPAAPDEGFAYWSAELGLTEGNWRFVRSGQCDLHPVFRGVDAAGWELAAGEAPTIDTQTIDVLVAERTCASGRSPAGRIVPAAIVYLDAHIVITFATRPLPGAQTCDPGPPAEVSLQLEERLGDRDLLDGSVIPPERRWP